MAPEKGTKQFLLCLAEKLVKADITSLDREIIYKVLDKASEKMKSIYYLKILDHKELYADLLQEYIQNLCSQKTLFYLPYNLYLPKEHCKIDESESNIYNKENDILLKNLLQIKFSSCGVTDILSMINNIENNECKTSEMGEIFQNLKVICGKIKDIKDLLKMMSISCQIVMPSTRKILNVYTRKKINSELVSLLTVFKTKFTNMENVSQEDVNDYYDYLAALCCLYTESVVILNDQSNSGIELSNFISYILKNSPQHQLGVILQIDFKLLTNVEILSPLIKKTFQIGSGSISCEMYLRYILTASHLCKKFEQLTSKIKIQYLKKICKNLKMPCNFSKWLIFNLPTLEAHLDKNDSMFDILMNCPDDIHNSLILFLSRNPPEQSENNSKTKINKKRKIEETLFESPQKTKTTKIAD